MTPRAVTAAGLVGILAAALAVGFGCSREPAASPSGPASKVPAPKAPGFTLRDLDGHPVSLASLRGKTVVIDFWATWCAPCEAQIPVLNAFHREHRGEGVVVLGVSVDADGRRAVVPFLKHHEIDYPVLLGNETLAMRYGAPGYPSLVVVDPQGRIESLHVGVIDRRDLDAAVARARQAGAAPKAAPKAAAGGAQAS